MVDQVVIGQSAWNLLSKEEQDFARKAGARTAGEFKRSPGQTIVSVGASPGDIALRNVSDVYFHVGPIRDITGKAGVTVPLIEQWNTGVINVVRWAARTQTSSQQLASHRDVVQHARHCADQYLNPKHVDTMVATSRLVASELIDAFAPVQVVLGTGFPWYCVDGSTARAPAAVPESIGIYTQTQARFFENKLLPESLRGELDSDKAWSPDQLAQNGVELGQTKFNAYEYERWDVHPPGTDGNSLLRESYAANLFDLAERDWPCHLCTTLHNGNRFPQRWERDFMKSCLECNQTPFIPRAVGVLGSDVDVVAIVDDASDPVLVAREIANWIDHHNVYFRHDTDWATQLGAPFGPLDAFVVRRSDFIKTTQEIAESDSWARSTVRASVTWLPVTELNYELGKYFVLCMEPLIDKTHNGAFTREIVNFRRAFASRITDAELFAFYESDSPYLQQLVGNTTVRNVISERLKTWIVA